MSILSPKLGEGKNRNGIFGELPLKTGKIAQALAMVSVTNCRNKPKRR
jgi:hypothetical protein